VLAFAVRRGAQMRLRLGEGGLAERVQEGRNREAQVVRYPRRKLFNKARRQVFLDWFGATCNMSWASEKAGVSYKTVSKHIRKDPDFAAEVHEAMQLGVLRAKAKLIETKKRESAPVLDEDGEEEVPELDMPHDQLIQGVREHGRTLALGRKRGRAPRVASNEEVLAALTKRVKAMWVRCERRHGRDGSAPPPCVEEDEALRTQAVSRPDSLVGSEVGPLHHAAHGSPPRAGEENAGCEAKLLHHAAHGSPPRAGEELA
jgi:hypothetical protein